MKKQIYIRLSQLGLLMALAVAPVYAQFQNPITVDVPFAFVVGEKSMPAGQYTIKSVNQTGPHSKLLIRSKDGRTALIFSAGSVQAKAIQKESKLTFNRYGDQYFLSQIWVERSDYGGQLAKSNIEIRAAAANGSGSNSVSVAAVKR